MPDVNDIQIIRHFTTLNVVTPYSHEFLRHVKLLGGKWDSNTKSWELPIDAEKELRKTLIAIFGKDDHPVELVTVHVNVKQDLFAERMGIEWWGRIIAYATGRDSGAKPGAKVAFCNGSPPPESGGSRARWKTIIREGTELDVYDVPVRAVYSRRYAGIEVSAYTKEGEQIAIHPWANVLS